MAGHNRLNHPPGRMVDIPQRHTATKIFDTMTTQNNVFQHNYNRIIIGIVSVIAIILLVFFFVRLFSGNNNNALFPQLPSPTPNGDIGIPQAILVNFTDLNNDPYAYVDQLIEVSGAYTPQVVPDCARYSGPLIRWALIAEDLQLDAVGYERIVKLLAPGTPMTVRGYWRLYDGPLGCGKGPARGSRWYLHVTMIMQPNPLIGADGEQINIDIENGASGLPPLQPTQPSAGTELPITPIFTPTFDPVLSPTATLDGTLPPIFTPSVTATFLPNITPSVTVTLDPLGTNTPLPSDTPSTIPTATAVDGTATNTPEGGAPTLTPELPGPLPTASPGSTSTPGTPYPTFTPYPTESPLSR